MGPGDGAICHVGKVISWLSIEPEYLLRKDKLKRPLIEIDHRAYARS